MESSWGGFKLAEDSLSSPTPAVYHRSVQCILCLLFGYEAKRAHRLHPFLSVVASAWNSQASDPRDKVYAMLGLPNSDSDPDKGELFLEPDYTLSTTQVYTKFAQRVLAKEQTLRLLSAVQHRPYAPISTPSWVPQWQPVTIEPLVPIGGVLNRMPDYSLPNHSIFTFDSELLVLRGQTIDMIADATVIIPFQKAVDISNTYLAAQDVLLKLPHLKILCWTLTVGRGNDLWASHVNHWDIFQALWLEARRAFVARDWSRIGHNCLGDDDAQPSLHSFLGSATHGRRVFVTSKGTIGLGPASLEPEDVVAVLFGGFTPFVLRCVDDHYVLIGECYIHGQMNGITAEDWESGEQQCEEFRLR
jgi:hypothetical protein